MRLVDLDPRFLFAGGDGVSGRAGQPVPRREGVGVSFACPCGCGTRCAIEFVNPLDGGPPTRTDNHTWKRTGETFETLTLEPSIQRVGGCAWHGHIRQGAIVGA